MMPGSLAALAHFGLEKTAVGTRLLARMRPALQNDAFLGFGGRQRDTLRTLRSAANDPKAWDQLMRTTAGQPHADVAASALPADPLARLHATTGSLPVRGARQFQDTFAPHVGSRGGPSPEQVSRVLASGRHGPTRQIHDVGAPTDILSGRAKGFAPQHVLWSGRAPGQVPRGASAWFSGYPQVSADYAQRAPGGRLAAYPRQATKTTGWTPYEGIDPLGPDATNAKLRATRRNADHPAWWKTPFFETTATHIPEPLAVYKPLPDGRFMQVRGRMDPLAGQVPPLPHNYLSR